MIRTLYLSILFCLPGLFLGCREDSKTITINFKLAYDDVPLVMFEDYTYPDGKKLQITRFSFYLSELSIKQGSEINLIKDVDFINLTKSHSSLEGARQGLRYMSEEIEGGFDAISFNFGLTETQNASVPADYSSGHPMAKPGEYWVAWDSYIFVKVEGWIDLDNDNTPETGVALHLGSNAVKRSMAKSISNPEEEIEIIIDVHALFENAETGKIYDIAVNPQLHSLSQLPAAEELADNLAQSISLNN
ncbi:MAG: hypothetical protein HKN87_00050 [Saprospiraceae bacterium]|nr:hypothetical protein [Saprospiraceae bacterium]